MMTILILYDCFLFFSRHLLALLPSCTRYHKKPHYNAVIALNAIVALSKKIFPLVSIHSPPRFTIVVPVYIHLSISRSLINPGRIIIICNTFLFCSLCDKTELVEINSGYNER